MRKIFSNLRRHRQTVILASVFLSLGAMISVFGNACSGKMSGFETSAEEKTSLASQAPLIANSSNEIQKIENQDYTTCFDGIHTPAEGLECLKDNPSINLLTLASFSQALAKCGTELGHPVYLAICLKNNGVVIKNHRPLSQLDIDKCVAAVGEGKIVVCLDKNGLLPKGLTQTIVADCIQAVGVTNLEKCFRVKGFLPRRLVLSQFDVNVCLRIAPKEKLYDCLTLAELVPTTNNTPEFVAADIDTCLNAGLPTELVKCLRTNGKLNRVLQANHIKRCMELVGPTKIAACLSLNGLLPSTAAGIEVTQDQITNCIATRGENDIIQCLRWDMGVMSKILSQADIKECTRAHGPGGVARCLSENSILPEGLTQAVIETCQAAAAAGAATGATVTKCLRKNGYLSKALLQGNVNQCLKLVPKTSLAACINANVATPLPIEQTTINECLDAAGVGEAKVAACLKKKGKIPNFLSQEHIKGCAAFVGADKIGVCLEGSGLIDPTVPGAISQANIDTCIANVGPSNVRKCLVNGNFLSKAVDEQAIAACTLFVGTADIAKCYAANGVVP